MSDEYPGVIPVLAALRTFDPPDPAMLERFTRRVRAIVAGAVEARIASLRRNPRNRYRRLDFDPTWKYHRRNAI